eukprot:CAMPEP_0185520380 /NCGR_PEP_ID=MMETSP1366-20130426/77207_1 /TAXON_ID=38817 /ORGANISM="Gephyrocapsa oceanica, Strain RCC1303" /LENGTH=188 /DNA_ID=CAMNT_0028131475 /DNA_START=101 /DNA_END=664 /DNA_ORIENTATION=-
MILRIRTKDGTERITADASATLSRLREQIEAQLGVPVGEQSLCRSEQRGPVPTKGAAFGASDDAQPLSALGLASGEILFLEYQRDRENTEKYVNKDPFVALAKEGDLRAQGSAQWTLTNFLDYRATKEFKLEATPEPHSRFVMVDPTASQQFINYCLSTGFGSKRIGFLYGRWAAAENGAAAAAAAGE